MNDLIDEPGDPLAGIDEAVAALRAAWAAGGEGSLLPASALKGSHLIAVNDALGLLQRRTSAVHAPVAAEIMRFIPPPHVDSAGEPASTISRRDRCPRVGGWGGVSAVPAWCGWGSVRSA